MRRRFHTYLRIALALYGLQLFGQDPPPEPDEDQAARQAWFYSQRAFPLGTIPPGARLNAITQLNRIDQAARARRQQAAAQRPRDSRLALTADAQNWTQIGPQPTGGGTVAATAGRINAIAVDPRDNNTAYLAAAEGGVWKTTDGGVTWTPLTDQQVVDYPSRN